MNESALTWLVWIREASFEKAVGSEMSLLPPDLFLKQKEVEMMKSISILWILMMTSSETEKMNGSNGSTDSYAVLVCDTYVLEPKRKCFQVHFEDHFMYKKDV